MKISCREWCHLPGKSMKTFPSACMGLLCALLTSCALPGARVTCDPLAIEAMGRVAEKIVTATNVR